MDPSSSFLGIIPPDSASGFRLRPRNHQISGSIGVLVGEMNPNGPPRFETTLYDLLQKRGPSRSPPPPHPPSTSESHAAFLSEVEGGGSAGRVVECFPTHDPSSSNLTSTSSTLGGGIIEDDLSDELDFSDEVLRYINQILMEEEDDLFPDKDAYNNMLQESSSADLQAKEKSFYEALGKKYPPSPDPPEYLHHPAPTTFIFRDDKCCYSSGDLCNDVPSSGSSNSNNGFGFGSYIAQPPSSAADYRATFLFRYLRAHQASSSSTDVHYHPTLLDTPSSPPCGSHSVWNFNKGVEEASKFLPHRNDLLNFSVNGLLPLEPAEEAEEPILKEETRDDLNFGHTETRGRKNPHAADTDLEERSSKQAAVYTESIVRSQEFDIVLLHSMGEGEAVLAAYRENLRTSKSKVAHQNGQPKLKESSAAKGRRKKQNGKKEVIDLRTLMIHCAQAIAADDRRTASELLKQIKRHASPFGDGNQRLAHSFADGLEARIAGTGSQIYKALVNKRTSAADFLKAYHLYLASCPFQKISTFASNKTIMIKSKCAMRLHVIDFGILYGFQWPTFIQRIAGREGGPPKVRITGVEFPQPGFRPAERLEETGRRLAEYAKMFKVPFEYNAVAKKWETIKLEDLKIEEGEFVVVNCIYRSKNLHDETVAVESSRTLVLKLIRSINPDIFIHGIVNGAYSAPFFVTRFREVLFHFSALFDMLETVVPREIPERTLIEKEFFGKEALNVIACEGWERVERPETYKQWQVRNLRAGFKQIPLEREIIKRAIEKVTCSYHKDFVIDEDSQWLLMGWKGRIIYSLSCWVPT